MTLFAIRLKSAREAAGYQDAESFARALGVEGYMYRKYERGEREGIKFRHLMRACALLNVTPNYLLGVDDRPNRAA